MSGNIDWILSSRSMTDSGTGTGNGKRNRINPKFQRPNPRNQRQQIPNPRAMTHISVINALSIEAEAEGTEEDMDHGERAKCIKEGRNRKGMDKPGNHQRRNQIIVDEDSISNVVLAVKDVEEAEAEAKAPQSEAI